MKIRIIVADDHRLMRQGLSSLLDAEPDLQVVGGADSGREAVSLTAKLQPDVVVIDIAMPDLNGVEATRQIKRDNPGVRILALSTHKDVRYATGMVQAGANGYVLKTAAFDQLAEAIRCIMGGESYLSPEIASVMMQDYAHRLRQDDSTPQAVLTEREREVIQLVAEGKSTREISEMLHLSPKTVDSHRQKMMDKLDLHTVAELTRYAIREGIVSPDA